MDDFNRLLGRLQWRLGCERMLQFSIHGALASGVALIALATATWLVGLHQSLLWAAGIPLAAAFAAALVRWPSTRAAALAADRRLGLDERLATAVDLSRRTRHGRFDALQIQDAFVHGSRAPSGRLALETRDRNEALFALGVAAVGLASVVWLPLVPRPVTSFADTAISRPGTTDLAERALPELSDQPTATAVAAQPTVRPTTDKDLASRVQQEKAARAALDSLAHALASVSAGQAAADAIQQGDFSAARDQLQNLADEADQLSDAAKQQLARALQQAATATAATDRQLSDRERQASQALGRTSYSEQRQALRALADQLARSGARSVPADQLQREVGRLQQQQSGPASNQSAPSAPGTSPSNQPATTGAGIGTGADHATTGDASQLDSAGQLVQVPSRLGIGQGVRRPDGTEEQSTALPSFGNRSVSELTSAQQMGQVAPEANVVPSEQRPVIRGYFR